MMKKIMRTIAAAAIASMMAGHSAQAASVGVEAIDIDFSFEGMFGTFDRGQLQRGFLVYKEVCASCHAMSLLRYRNLGEPGGPEFTPEQVKAIAAQYEVQDGPNADGEMFDRPALPRDAFVSPFPNEQAARASNGGAYPLDLSLIAKARQGWTGNLATAYTTALWKGTGGPEYIYSVLVGYADAPNGEEREGLHYNKYFPGHWIAMPSPMTEDGVEYGDGTKATVDQQARDVAAFLMWAAEPKMEERKSLGFKVLIYLFILSVLMYLTKKMIWSRVEH